MKNNSEKVFDRGKCFTFFSSFYKQGNNIKKILGEKKALEYYESIIEYALYQKSVEDPELLILIGNTTLDLIDQSQNRRARVFQGEDIDITRSILETQRDHPEVSQNKLAEIVGCSKGKVNKVLTKFKNGGYSGVFDFDITINGILYSPSGISQSNSNSNNKNNNNSNSSDHDRDRCAVTDSGSLSNDVADTPERSASLAQQQKYNEIDFNGLIKNSDMPGIIQREYHKLMRNVSEGELSVEDMRDSMIQEFTSGFFKCKREPVSIYVDYLITHNGLTER